MYSAGGVVSKVRLVSSVGLGEFAFEEGGDGVDAVVSERGETGETELAEHTGRDVGGSHEHFEHRDTDLRFAGRMQVVQRVLRRSFDAG